MRLAARALLVLPAAAVSVPGVVGCGGSTFTAGSAADAGAPPLPPDGGALDASHTGFCPATITNEKFCDDFDEGEPLSVKWVVDAVGATAETDPTIFVSPPDSFEADAPSGVGTRARISRGFEAASRVTIGFDLHIDKVAADVGNGTVLSSMSIGGYSIGIGANTTDVYLYEAGVTADAAVPSGGLSATPAMLVLTNSVQGNWTHVVVDVQLAAGKVAGSVGTTSYGPLPITPPTGTPTVYFGTSSKAAAPETEAHYDNITVDVTP